MLTFLLLASALSALPGVVTARPPREDDRVTASEVNGRARTMRAMLRDPLQVRMNTMKHIHSDPIRSALDMALALDDNARDRLRAAAPNASTHDLEEWFDGEGDLHLLAGPDGHFLEVTSTDRTGERSLPAPPYTNCDPRPVYPSTASCWTAYL